MLVHRLARPLLAAIFVASGIDTLREPEGPVKTATPFLQAVLGRVEALPAGVPTDPATIVRLDAGLKILAGLGMALDRFPRMSALVLAANLVPTTLAAHSYWEHEDLAARAHHRTEFLRNLSLLGGLLATAAASSPRQRGV
jgi:uncharacterized membrane protein YphA (DoxX/SURF4 family)